MQTCLYLFYMLGFNLMLFCCSDCSTFHHWELGSSGALSVGSCVPLTHPTPPPTAWLLYNTLSFLAPWDPSAPTYIWPAQSVISPKSPVDLLVSSVVWNQAGLEGCFPPSLRHHHSDDCTQGFPTLASGNTNYFLPYMTSEIVLLIPFWWFFPQLLGVSSCNVPKAGGESSAGLQSLLFA